MRRYRMTVRYDGTDFSGSQIQPGRRTVQGTLKAELENILRQELSLLFASRTDSGVHADGNVCSFDADFRMPAEKLPAALNRRCGPDLEVRDIIEVSPDFHPRFDAVLRSYVYRIHNAADTPVDRRRYVLTVHEPLDTAGMTEALGLLPGWHSFQSYTAGIHEPKDCRCNIVEALLEREGEELGIRLSANRFLRHMVCRLSGALLAIGRGRLSVGQFAASLEERMEFQFRPAPPKGLTLIQVVYPEDSQNPGAGEQKSEG